MRNRFSGLRDDDFLALGNPIEELNNVCGGFGKGDVGNHGFQRDGEFYYNEMTFGIENVECKKGGNRIIHLQKIMIHTTLSKDLTEHYNTPNE